MPPSSPRWEILEKRKALLIPLVMGIVFFFGFLFQFVLGHPFTGEIILIAALLLPFHALWVLVRDRPNRRATLRPVFGALLLGIIATAIAAAPEDFLIVWFGGSLGRTVGQVLPVVAISLAGLLFLSSIFVLVSRCTTVESDISALKERLDGYRERGKALDATYRSLFDSCPVPTVSLDMSQYISAVNPAWSKFLGYSASESLGQPMASFMEDRGLPGAAGLFGSEESCAVFHTHLCAKGGGLSPARVTVVPIEIDGESHGFQCFFEDATHLFAVEREMLLLQRARSLRPLADNVARSIVAASRGVQLVVRWVRGQRVTVEEAKQATTAITQALRRSGGLADNLRLFQQALLEPPDISNVNVIVKRVIDFVQRLEPVGITVQEECADEDLLVFAQTAELEQVLINLCLNAVEAMPRGGILRVATEQVPNRRGPRTPPSTAQITITDTGKGIDPSIAQWDFSAYRIPEEEPGKPGLGLILSHRVLRRYGGRLSLQPNGQRGARVTITLPLRSKTKASQESTARTVQSTMVSVS